MSEQDIAEIEISMKEAKASVDLGKSLERLTKNRDFKKIIIDGYFEEEAVRLVHYKADPNAQDPEKQAAIVKDMDAIGSLVDYFRTINARANWAESAIKAAEEELDEIRAEG